MIRRAETDADLAGWCAVWNAITPREPTSVEFVRQRLARHPDRLYLIAEDDGRIVGAGFAGDSDSPGRAALAVRVLPESREQGIGSALYEPAMRWSRDQGSEWASGMVAEDDAVSRAWAERRGFEEYGRQVELVLELRGGGGEPSAPPEGIEIVEVTEELHPDAYALAQEAWRDLPTPTPMEAPPYEEWLEEDLSGPVAFAALDNGELVGFAGLIERAAPGLLEHGLTATRRSHRRRGIATALKRTVISWAAANGYRELITFTQDRNEGMQAINLALGYRAQPAWISVRRRP